MSGKIFDFCIGNPPYNEEFGYTGDNDNFGQPVYHKFMDAANEVAEKVELIHPARFLFNTGSTPEKWNEKMLNDTHFKVLHYEENASNIFKNTDIKGGVAITYHDSETDFGPIKIFTKYPELNTILKKVSRQMEGRSLSDIIHTQNRFNLTALYEVHPEYRDVIGSHGKDKRFRNNIFTKVPAFKTEPEKDTDIPTYGLVKLKRVWRYIDSDFVEHTHENLGSWKVLAARANGSGQFGETLSTLVVLKPGEAYTQTFIGFGPLSNEIEANNVTQYLKTKFARAMLCTIKVTQDNDREAWRMVPLQDFTEKSDIDWTTSIHDIDMQLYIKYGLSESEISFIENNVKEMV